MFPFGVTIPATVPQRSEISEGLMNYSVYYSISKANMKYITFSEGTSLGDRLNILTDIS